MKKYVLDSNGQPVEEKDISKWGRSFDKSNRIVKQDHVSEVLVSTVFLAIDHNYSGKGPPVLWETMIFGGPHDGYCERYTSRKDAEEGHEKAVEMVKPYKISQEDWLFEPRG